MSIAPAIAKGLPVLPVPQVPGRHDPAADGGTAVAFTAGHHFTLNGDADVTAFTRVRGDYDKAMTGVRAFIDAGIPLSLSAVVLRSTLHALPYLCQIAGVLDAGKLKLILPLRRGNALGLAEREFISVDEACDVSGRLTGLRATHDWRPAVRLTPWTNVTEGHMIVIEPSGSTHAWPVYDQPDLFLRLGNLLEEPISAIWDPIPLQEQPLRQIPRPQHLHRRPRRCLICQTAWCSHCVPGRTWPGPAIRTGRGSSSTVGPHRGWRPLPWLGLRQQA